jgi:hypothetical protein
MNIFLDEKYVMSTIIGLDLEATIEMILQPFAWRSFLRAIVIRRRRIQRKGGIVCDRD